MPRTFHSICPLFQPTPYDQSLVDRRAVLDAAGDADVFDPRTDKVATAQFAIDSQIGHHKVAAALLNFESNTDRRHVLPTQLELLPTKRPLFPGALE